jgi:hypothetical protein
MKKLLACAVIAVLPLAACDEDSGNWPTDVTTDWGGDGPADSGPDISADLPSDTGGPDSSGSCDNDLGTFSPTDVLAGDMSSLPDVTTAFWTVRAPLPGLTWESNPFGMVDIEVVHGAGGPSTPTTVNITSYEGMDATTTLIIVVEGCTGDLSTCTGIYIAEQATFEITEIGLTPGSALRATLSNAIMSSWDPGTDSILTGGPQYCLDLWSIDVTMTDPSTWGG